MTSSYDEICRELHITDKDISRGGRCWLRKIGQLHIELDKDTSPSVWIAIALFLASIPSNTTSTNAGESNQSTKILLTQVLLSTGLSVEKFITYLGRFSKVYLLEPNLLRATNQFKEHFATSSLLYTKYKSLWSVHGPDTTSERSEQLFKFGWLLLNITERRLKKAEVGLSDLYIYLLAITNFILANTKASSDEAEVAAALSFLGSSQPPIDAPPIDSALCKNPEVDKLLVEKATIAFIAMLDTLVEERVLSCSRNELMPVGVLAVGIFDKSVLPENLDRISSYFQVNYVGNICMFDSRVFLSDQIGGNELHQTAVEDNGGMSPIKQKASSEFRQAWSYFGQQIPEASQPASPLSLSPSMKMSIRKHPLLQAPIAATIELNQWKAKILSGNRTAPSNKLLSYFGKCSNNPTKKITELVNSLEQRISSKIHEIGFAERKTGDQNLSDKSECSTVNLQACKLAVCLYFQVTEDLLIAEEVRLKKSDHGVVLHSAIFHKSLFACCTEIAFKAHSLVYLSFPKVLPICGVEVFDFCKVVECVVKHAPTLPRLLKRHLQDIEQQILEHYAWQKTSVLFSRYRDESPTRLLTESEESSLKSKRASLLLFYRKVFSLAARKLHCFCEDLSLEQGIINQIWTSTKECLSKHSKMLADRHLDSILLCNIYGVCKANRLVPEITFKTIIEVYKKSSSTEKSHDIYHNIVLDGNTYGNIVQFYNRCYIPAMKRCLLQFQEADKQDNAVQVASSNIKYPGARNNSFVDDITEAAKEAARSMSPDEDSMDLPLVDVAELPVVQVHPSKQVTSNVFISPRRPKRRSSDMHQSPKTHALYSFGESPSSDLQMINRVVKMAKSDFS